MADITLVELNLQGAESTIHLPFSGSVSKTAGDADEAEDATESSSRFSRRESGGGRKGKGIGVLVGLAFLIALAALANRRRGGDDDDGGVDIGTADDESDVVTVADEE